MNSTSRLGNVFCVVVIVAAILIVYGEIGSHEYVSLDDTIYITNNPVVQGGLSLQGLKWAFLPPDGGLYWQPATWISLMVSASLFDLDPFWVHWENVWLHVLSALLLFLLAMQIFGDRKRALIVALLFAIHPINVEAVAWAVERKAVLSMFFGLASTVAFVFSVKHRTNERRSFLLSAVTLFFLIISLLAKPIFVIAPALFAAIYILQWRFNRTLSSLPKASLMEGAPILLIAATAVVVGLFVIIVALLFGPPATISYEVRGLDQRLAASIWGSYHYAKTWFTGLSTAAYYPYPPSIAVADIIRGTLAIGVAVLMAIVARKRAPELTFGVALLALSLLPTIGIIQVGMWPAFADRFMYLGTIGLGFAMVAPLRLPVRFDRICLIVLAVWIGYLSIMARGQVSTWKNSISLYEHCLKNSIGIEPLPGDTRSEFIRGNYSQALARAGRHSEAVVQLVAALMTNPLRLGITEKYVSFLEAKGEYGPADILWSEYQDWGGDAAGKMLAIGQLLENQKAFPAARNTYGRVLERQPGNVQAHENLGRLVARSGDLGKAIGLWEEALEMTDDPDVKARLRRMITEYER
jgi:tetratricopeptide (TPR) repeat protein